MSTILYKTLLVVGIATWVGSVGFGLNLLAQRENTPGVAAQTPASWPSDSRLPRSTDGWTLLMFVHPRCPCSRASVDELAALLRDCPVGVQACLVFYKPRGFPADWERTGLWSRAGELAGARLVCDDGEAERERFGVFTSGQVLLYDNDGLLRYSGGLTRARGVGGSSLGRASLLAVLAGESRGLVQVNVFGCSLVSDKDGLPSNTLRGSIP